MKFRRKICCQENLSVSSIGVNDNSKYIIPDNDELNNANQGFKMQKMTKQLSQSDGNVFQSSITQSNKSSLWSWFLGLFNHKRKVDSNLPPTHLRDAETDESSSSKKAKISVSDLLNEYSTKGETNSKALNGEKDDVCGAMEAESGLENVKSTPAENQKVTKPEIENKAQLPNIEELPKTETSKMTSTSTESLTARLNKINLEQIEKRISSECLKIADEHVAEREELQKENVTESSETEIDGDVNEQELPLANDVEEVLNQPKKSVKEMQALLNIPMMTPMQQKSLSKSPARVPVLPMISVQKANDEKTPDENENHSESVSDFCFEKQKIILRQRTKNSKRPISKKFRNSMQISSGVLDDIMNEDK